MRYPSRLRLPHVPGWPITKLFSHHRFFCLSSQAPTSAASGEHTRVNANWKLAGALSRTAAIESTVEQLESSKNDVSATEDYDGWIWNEETQEWVWDENAANGAAEDDVVEGDPIQTERTSAAIDNGGLNNTADEALAQSEANRIALEKEAAEKVLADARSALSLAEEALSRPSSANPVDRCSVSEKRESGTGSAEFSGRL